MLTRYFLCAGLALGVCCVGLSSANAMAVQPLVLDIQAGRNGNMGSLTVSNSFGRAIPVELTVYPLGVSATGVVAIEGDPVDDFLIYPPAAVIEPGQTQTFRLRWMGPTDLADSRNYIVSIAQVPVALDQADNGIQIVYNFQIMANVAPRSGEPILSVRDAQLSTTVPSPANGEASNLSPASRPQEDGVNAIARVTLQNDGLAHGYLAGTRLLLRSTDSAGTTVWEQGLSGAELQGLAGFGLVPDQASRSFSIPIVVPQSAFDGTFSADVLGYDGLP
jgi:fimbrial chaperone protein